MKNGHLRIIGGEFRGRKLLTIPGRGVRPTADRLRETLFNIIQHTVPGAAVVDLFAGTGALGIEAISRGASHGVLLDNFPPSLQVIRQNILQLGLTARVQVIHWDIQRNLRCLANLPWPIQVVFMDPPYDRQLVQHTLTLLEDVPCLAPGVLIAAEHHRHEAVPSQTALFLLQDQRSHGQTRLSFYQRRE